MKAVFPLVVGEFGRIALEFLRRGTSPKIYEGAASKTEPEILSVDRGSLCQRSCVSQSGDLF